MLWVVLFIISLIAAFAAAGLAVYLYADRKHLRGQRDQLVAQADELGRTNDELTRANHELEKDIAVVRETHRNLEEKLKQAQQDLREAFKSLAGDALEQSTKQFLELARKTFEGEQKDAVAQLEQRKSAIENMLKPIRETLQQHAKAVGEIEKNREGAYHSLRQQLASMLDDQRRLREEASALANAIRGTGTRGQWGEMTLKRIAEMAGMVRHCDFREQVTVWKGDDAQRPDMVVHMPSDRTIVVDSKGIGSNYLQALESTSDSDRAASLKQHLEDIRRQVVSLSRKAYYEQFDRSPDFVVLFMPSEAFLQPAVELQPDLIDWAIQNHVAIATPTMLIGLLKVVEMGWREERMAENAARVCELGRELHNRIGTAFDHLGRLGKALGTTVSHYNRLVGSVESSVLPQSRRFKELGADSSKELPAELDKIEAAPREPAQPELLSADESD